MIKFLETSNTKKTHPSNFVKPDTAKKVFKRKSLPVDNLEILIPHEKDCEKNEKESSPIKKISVNNKRGSLSVRFFFPKKESSLDLEEIMKKTHAEILKQTSLVLKNLRI